MRDAKQWVDVLAGSISVQHGWRWSLLLPALTLCLVTGAAFGENIGATEPPDSTTIASEFDANPDDAETEDAAIVSSQDAADAGVSASDSPEAQLVDDLPESSPEAPCDQPDAENFSCPGAIDMQSVDPSELSEGETPVDPCDQYDAEYDSWLDRSQVRIYNTVCETAAWFDGFFGDYRYDRETGNTYGRIGVGSFYDQRDGWDQDFRLRAKYALPSIRRKGSLLVGRGDEEELIEERTVSELEGLPSRGPNDDRDDSLYVGFGFRGFEQGARGLDYSVGVKVRSSPELYAKSSYHQGWNLSPKDYVRLRPILYWKSDEGVGSTLTVEYDRLIGEAMLFRWGNFGNISEDSDVDGVAWGESLSLFQVLSKRRALTYRVFVSGETGNEVPVKNYGFEFRYRQRILREWLFIEYLGRLSWPRQLIIEDRDSNLGAGIQLQAYFGPAPESWVR